ncbi:MAG: ribosomal RNA small subunit methyltransferase A [Alphaproteobacteria bacterium]|nr:ribosomal RNA small subunit methyltransferase A [Alphaproteobacteria bacterium]
MTFKFNDNDFNLTIYQVIRKYNLIDNNPRMRALGQNFIVDESLLDKIAKSASPINKNDCIIEVGPGPCNLTRSILSHYDNEIICIERDLKFKSLHDNLLKNTNKNIRFIYDDALNIKISKLTNKRIVIISNLPYNVGTALITNWLLNDINQINEVIVMLQDEVIDRICSPHSNRNYGKISVLTQLLCNVEKLFTVSNKVFIPSPNVTSAVIKITPKHTGINNVNELFNLLNNCFIQRRKMIYSTVQKSYSTLDKNTIIDILNKCNISSKQRPGTVSPEQYYELSKYLSQRK